MIIEYQKPIIDLWRTLLTSIYSLLDSDKYLQQHTYLQNTRITKIIIRNNQSLLNSID